MFLTVSDFWANIAEAIQDFINNIPNWNWSGVWEWAKGIATTVGWGGLFAIIIRYIIPFVKDANKPTLTALAQQAEILGALELKIKSLDEANRTVGTVLTEWIGLQSEVNVLSKTLTDEQKQAFVLLADRMKAIPSLLASAEKIEQIVADSVVTADEAKDLIASTELGQAVLGTNLNDIIPKE